MQGYRAYLVGVGVAPGVAWIGRHRSAGRRWSWQAGRHRARPVATSRRILQIRGQESLRIASRRRALPAGLAMLLVILAAATLLSGWSAASGAVAFVGMIAR